MILLRDAGDILPKQLTVCKQVYICSKIAELGLDPDSIEGLDDIFKSMTDPFEVIETCHLQEKHSLKHLVSL